jgi:hypothetical protein
MAAGDVKIQYAASVALTQTALDALASDTTFLAGWESDAIDNSTNKYTDYRITAKIQAESAGLTAGQIRMYVVSEMDDSTWPDVFDGTQGAETITSAEIRDAIAIQIAATLTTTTASRTYPLVCASLRRALGNVPRKFVIFITHSMVAATESTGDPNQVYVQGMYENVAAA